MRPSTSFPPNLKPWGQQQGEEEERVGRSHPLLQFAVLTTEGPGEHQQETLRQIWSERSLMH